MNLHKNLNADECQDGLKKYNKTFKFKYFKTNLHIMMTNHAIPIQAIVLVKNHTV